MGVPENSSWIRELTTGGMSRNRVADAAVDAGAVPEGIRVVECAEEAHVHADVDDPHRMKPVEM
jgi:hypothetical protein